MTAPPPCWLHPAVEIRGSDIAGRGWFATAPAWKRTRVWYGAPGDCPLNHSCDPTLWWCGDVLIARRDLAEGEEFTVDYSTGTADSGFLMACHCGSYRCRQLVTGDDWRIPELQRRYAGHWAPDLQRLVDEAVP